MKEMLSKRNSTVEGLRILSMFLIVMFHFYGRGLGLFDLDSYRDKSDIHYFSFLCIH